MINSNEGQQWVSASLGDTRPAKEISQVDELLTEHASLLSALSSEIVQTRKRFDVVLLPECLKAESTCAQGAPVPARSALGYAIKEQSELVRSMLSDLRSINERSTV